MEDDKISIDDIKKAITESGYLIEQRVESIISKKEFYVETNDIYKDEETGKTREIDLTALKGSAIFNNDDHWIFPYLIIECENNHQPIVFFRNNTSIEFLHHYEIKLSGIPTQIYSKAGEDPIEFASYIGCQDFHHYCTGVFSTQYCSFQQTNKANIKKWMALHIDSQHDSLQSIIKCLRYKMKQHYNGYQLPPKDECEKANINVYYPLIILQGELFEAFIERGELKLKSQNHIQFRKQIVTNEDVETFQIDVIKEAHLKKYLSIVDNEIKEITTRLKRRKKVIEQSIEVVVKKLRDEADKSKHIHIFSGNKIS